MEEKTFTVYHDDGADQIVDKIAIILESYGLSVVALSEDGAEFLTYKIEPLP
jgi:hypothetical protein